ncbi:MAG TPA: hypothetical protein VKT77_03520 [Chthonomonadaceae bacterium]|nr:hypothetical protein [Chthonomonadaceae bacterium]
MRVRLSAAAAMLLAAAIAAGCGGGGGSSAPPSPASAGKAAGAIARRTASFFVTGPSASSDRSAGAPRLPLSIAFGIAFARGQGAGLSKSVDTTFLPSADLYFAVTAQTDTSATVSFFTDAAGTMPAGTIKIALRSSPGTFPVTETEALDVHGGFIDESGNATITINDSSASSGHIAADFVTNKSGDRLTINMSVDFNGTTLTGSLAATDSCVSSTLTNIVADGSTGAFDANIQVKGFTGGTVHVSADRSGTVVLNNSAGATTANINADGSGSIQFPDGHTESVSNFDTIDPCGA